MNCNWIAATVELLRKTVNNLEKKNIELKNDILDLTTKLNGEIINELFYVTRLKESEFHIQSPNGWNNWHW